jgi:predicted glutamine amidotransferase
MCRLLGVVSRTPQPLVDAVRHELPLFTALSELHKDGWGVAWYEGDDEDAAGSGAAASGVPTIRRGTDTALASNAYGDAVEEAHGEVMTVHLRRASAGLALRPENTHPFAEGPITFSHNGQFDLSDALRERILARGGRRPVGTTDSELFLSLITAAARRRAGRNPDWAGAIQEAADELDAWCLEEFGRPAESLNCLLTTPDELVAFSRNDPAQAPADRPPEVYELRYRADPGRVLVTSTGYEQDGFTTIPQGGAITIRRGSLQVTEHAPAR